MSASRQLAYLKALDIDVWRRRDLAPDAAEKAPIAAESVARQVAASPSVAAPAQLRAAPEPIAAPTQGSSGATLLDAPASPDVSALGWDDLFTRVRTCTLCPLHATRTQGVFGVGNRQADWMVIGEAPGQEEDRQGEPFVGRAGQLLNSMLKAVGLAREQVFIANILKSRPPGNRDPRPEEVRACLPYLFRQIELIDPKIVLCVGRIAAQTLLETETPIGKLRGKLHRLASDRPMIVTYHPAYLLRSPAEKRKAWADLMLAVRTYESLRS
jgi:uracil-DNA glycosylase family 4